MSLSTFGMPRTGLGTPPDERMQLTEPAQAMELRGGSAVFA